MAANTNFAIAVHALSVLAYLDGRATSDQIAKSINTNAVVVRRVLGRLGKVGLVSSVHGKHGGFTLSRPADQIQLVDVLRAVDDGSVFRIHDNEKNPRCPVSCAMQGALADVLERVEEAVDRELAKTSLADIVRSIP